VKNWRWGLVAWVALVLAVYYRQAWWLLASGPQAWSAPDLGFGAGPVHLPFLRDALGRTVRGGAAAALVATAACVLGRAAQRLVVPDLADRVERLVLTASFGVGTLGVVLLAAAWAGHYTPRVVTAVVSLVVAAGAVDAAWRRSQRRVEDGAEKAASRCLPGGVGPHPVPALPGEGLARALTFAALGLALFCALTPESEYDALWYHLELPRRWLAAGRPVDDISEYVSLYPLHWELLFGAALPIGGTVGAKLLHWAMLPACGAVAALWARRMDASPWLAAAFFVTAPTVFWESTAAYADLALALHVGVGCWALARAFETASQRWVIASGLSFGFACATKHLGLLALASAAIVFVGSGVLGRRSWRRHASAAALVIVLALAIATPWYAWAYARSGNPVFPEMYGVFGATPPERWSPDTEEALARFKAHFSVHRTGLLRLVLPWDVTMHGAEYGGTYGPMVLALAPCAAVAMRRRRAALALGVGTMLYLAGWVSPISSLQARFLVTAMLALAPLLAAGVRDALPARRVMLPLIAAALLLNLPPATPLHEGDREGWAHWLTHVERTIPAASVLGGVSDDEYLRRQVRSYAAWQWINQHTPPGARVLAFSGGDHYYARRPRLWSDAEAARDVTWWARSADAALAALDDIGIDYVLLPQPRIRTPKEQALPLVAAIERGALAKIYEDGWYLVYRRETETSAPGAATDQR